MHQQNPIIRTIPISRIRNSTTYIFAGECTARIYYPPPYGTDPSDFEDIDKDDGAIQCLLFTGEDGTINMHRQGNNILFADNHVATFKHWDDMLALPIAWCRNVNPDWESAKPEIVKLDDGGRVRGW